MPIRPTLLALLATITLQPAVPQTSSPSLTTGTQLVVVDVAVTDNKQNPVHGLSASDFIVLENNTPEHINSFEEHTTANAAKPEPPLVLPPGTFTNYTSVPANAPLNILLLDTLNTPLDAQTYVQNQIRLFLKNSPPNAPLAIFGLGSHLWLLQPFTADPQLLRSAVGSKALKSSPLLESTARGDGSDSLSEKMQELGGNDVTQSQVIKRMQQFEAEHNSDSDQLRARYTLEALNQLGRYLAGLPGKKNLIWFSGSFPLSVLPDGSLLGPYTDPFSTVANSSDLFRETTQLLAQSQVAVYPVDARGLSTSSVYAAEESGLQYDTGHHSIDTFLNNVSHASAQTASDNLTMLQMAEQTGGHAFVNTNGLADAVARSIQTGSNYYTLTYSPTKPANDGKFHSIQLKLRRDGYTLAYRRGYYADAPAPAAVTPNNIASNAVPRLVPLSTESSAPMTDPMHSAMVFGSPTPTQITLKVLVVLAAGHPEETLASGNYAIPSAHINGPYNRYDITIAADPSAIVFTTTASGNHHASLQFRTYLYAPDGRLINTSSRVREADLTPDLYTRALHSGLFFHQQISVPIKGEFYLRIGVHDVTADHDGAIEIPLASVKNLPPVTIPPSTQPLTRRQ